MKMPYLKEIDRESRRNAILRNEERWDDDETDIMENVHLKRRKKEPSRNRWIRMAMETKSIDMEASIAYLQEVQAEIEKLGSGKRKHKWTRTVRFGRLETV